MKIFLEKKNKFEPFDKLPINLLSKRKYLLKTHLSHLIFGLQAMPAKVSKLFLSERSWCPFLVSLRCFFSLFRHFLTNIL